MQQAGVGRRVKPKFEGGDPYADPEDGDGKTEPFWAVQNVRKAAEGGHVNAMVQLALMLRAGDGCEVPKPAQAREWFRRAAEAGNQYGQEVYAQFLLRGEGGPKDEQAGGVWLEKAKAAGRKHQADR